MKKIRPHINALAEFLDIPAEEIQPETYRKHLFDTPAGEYLVLTDSEATARARGKIAELLWAFQTDFIAEMCGFSCNSGAIAALRVMQERCCESCNALIRSLIVGSCGLSHFCDTAITADGREHFLADYDGVENEQGDYFIYRVN